MFMVGFCFTFHLYLQTKPYEKRLTCLVSTYINIHWGGGFCIPAYTMCLLHHHANSPMIQGSLSGTHFGGGIKLDANIGSYLKKPSFQSHLWGR